MFPAELINYLKEHNSTVIAEWQLRVLSDVHREKTLVRVEPISLLLISDFLSSMALSQVPTLTAFVQEMTSPDLVEIIREINHLKAIFFSFARRHELSLSSLEELFASIDNLTADLASLLIDDSPDNGTSGILNKHLTKDDSPCPILIEKAPAGLSIANTDQKPCSTSRDSETYTGQNFHNPPLGFDLGSLMQAEDLASACEIILPAEEAQGPISYLQRIRHTGGESRWNLLKGKPFFNSSSKFLGWVGASTEADNNIKTQEKLAESERILDQIFEESPSFMVIHSLPDFRLQKANRQFFKLLGRGDVVGKLVSDLVPEGEAEMFLSHMREVVISRQPFTGSSIPLTKAENGKTEKLYIDLVYTPVIHPNGEIIGIMAQGYDVTEKVLARNQLERSREQLYELFVRSPIAISACRIQEGQLKFTFANPNYERMIGRTDVVGKFLHDVIPQIETENPELWKIIYDVSYLGKVAHLHEIPVILDWNNTGEITERCMNISYEPLFNDQGEPDGLIVFVVDVTTGVMARKQLEKAKQELDEARLELRAVLDATPTYIARIDASECVIFENKANEAFSPGSSLVGSYLNELPDVYYTQVKPHIDTALRGETVTFELSVNSPITGQSGTFRFTYTPERNEDRTVNGFLSTAIDITDIKIAEQQMKLSKEQAEAANRIKSSFLANMSHEIRTPMTAILGFTELLKRNSLSEEMREDAIGRIESSSRSLLRLIEDVLDISKIEAGKLTIQKATFSPAEVVDEVVSVLRLTAERKGISLEVEIDPSTPRLAYCDAARLRQILINLIGNAVKFTIHGGVRILVHAECEKTLIFEVIDAGIGISEEAKPKLFVPFFQGDDSITRSYAGTGLGLALSRSLAEQMGGNIELAESTLGKGSRFVARFESAPFVFTAPDEHVPKKTKEEPQVELGRDLTGIEVLLAEDVESNQIIMKIYLEGAGAQVFLVNNGREAVDQALQHDFDVVLMDMQMPVLGGAEATRELRSRGYKVPILALTAHAMAEDVIRSLEAGCDAHLTKPITASGLISAVWNYARGP